jgi:hypothetical protein
MQLEVILDKLQARRVGHSWMAKCPCHEDSTASLSIDEKNGLILFYDHGAQCTTEAICAAIGITTRDLHTDEKPRAEVTATYDYCDEAGRLLYQVLRYFPKTFRQRHSDGKDGWIWNLNGTRRVLYGLPAVLNAAHDKIVIVEGEKDVETAWTLDLVATCNNGGAGKWQPEFSECLRDKHVTIIPDNDAPGFAHAEQVAEALHLIAASVRICKLPDGIKDVTEYSERGFSAESLHQLIEQAPVWTETQAEADLFHTPEECLNIPEIVFAIFGFLQCDALTFIGGLSGHAKTWLLLSIVKALLTGEKLWGLFNVRKRAKKTIYLIPEVGLASFMSRIRRMGLLPYIENKQLLVRTLTKGPAPDLKDPRILAAVKGAHVVLDTAARFADGEENSASDNARGLAADIFALITAGAETVMCAHHSPKNFLKETVMSLEGVLRGTGDIGAIATTVWAVKQLDEPENIVHLECVKARDFTHCEPFQLRGRPCIDETGDFQLHRAPGECGNLADEQPNVNENRRRERDDRKEMVRKWDQDNPGTPSTEIVERFKANGIDVDASTVRKYRTEIVKEVSKGSL